MSDSNALGNTIGNSISQYIYTYQTLKLWMFIHQELKAFPNDKLELAFKQTSCNITTLVKDHDRVYTIKF